MPGTPTGCPPTRTRRWLLAALALIVVFMAGEVIVGLLAGSLALLSGAAHMLTDAASIVLALVAINRFGPANCASGRGGDVGCIQRRHWLRIVRVKAHAHEGSEERMQLISGVRRRARLAAMVTVGFAAALAVAAPAEAHIPVVLTDANTAAALARSPYVPDGTVSFAFYGWLDRPGDTRAVRIHLQAGQQFTTQLLIPDITPENALRQWQLPRLAVIDPAGRVQILHDAQRTAFHEEYTNTDYLILAETTQVATTGTYGLIVFGATPTRFVAVSGDNEQFTAAIENAVIGNLTDVLSWYRTPAGTEHTTTAG